MTSRHRLIRVPASSANLGPGYDVMAAALDLHLELEVVESSGFSVECAGIDVPVDRSNLVVRAFEELHPADGVGFSIRSEIPLARGLGSSAAAIVAGLVAADHLFELALSREDLLAKATELEGHPDNVGASIYGGIVICGEEGGRPVATRVTPPEGLEAIVVIPHRECSTSSARSTIPAKIPIGEAVANIASAAQLALGLQTGDQTLIRRGLTDSIHQRRRQSHFPQSMELVDTADEYGALGATISGAGPSVLVWTTWEDAGRVVPELEARCEGWADVRRIAFTLQGADVPEL